MTTYQLLSLMGVGTLCSLLVTFIFNAITNNAKARKKKEEELRQGIAQDNVILKTALQALLRDRLIALYAEWAAKGYAPYEVRMNFENIYEQYHQLGVNGVMDDIHHRFLQLPMSRTTLDGHTGEEESN